MAISREGAIRSDLDLRVHGPLTLSSLTIPTLSKSFLSILDIQFNVKSLVQILIP